MVDRVSLRASTEATETRDNLWMATLPGPMNSPEPCRRTIVERGEWCPAPIRGDPVRSRARTENDRQRGDGGEAGRGVRGRRGRRPTPPVCLEPRIHPTALGHQRKAKSSDDHGNGNIRVIEKGERALRRFGGARGSNRATYRRGPRLAHRGFCPGFHVLRDP